MSTLVRVIVNPGCNHEDPTVIEVVVQPQGQHPHIPHQQGHEEDPPVGIKAEQTVRLSHPYNMPSVTPAIFAEQDYYISCHGDIRFADGLDLEAVYARVYTQEHPDYLTTYNKPLQLGLQPNGYIVNNTFFRFFGSKHSSGDGQRRLIVLPVSPYVQSVQWLYVWARMEGNVWAQPKQVKMLLIHGPCTGSGDIEL